jgi:hypothetical protein
MAARRAKNEYPGAGPGHALRRKQKKQNNGKNQERGKCRAGISDLGGQIERKIDVTGRVRFMLIGDSREQAFEVHRMRRLLWRRCRKTQAQSLGQKQQQNESWHQADAQSCRTEHGHGRHILV